MPLITHSTSAAVRRLKTSLFALLLFASASASAVPNMVVVMVDDLGMDAYAALVDGGFMPNLSQSMIAGGVEFKNSFVTNSMCCPSRATLLTGQYSHNHRVYSNNSPHPLKPGINWPGWFPEPGKAGHEESTIATWLNDGGYNTGFVGKYLNGYGRFAPYNVSDPETYVPPGWDEWNGLIDPHTYRVFDYELNQSGTVVNYGSAPSDYQTDVLAARAVDFVQRAAAGSAPFFLLVTPLAPHLEVVNPVNILEGNEPRDGFGLTVRPAPRHEYLIDGDLANGEVPDLVHKPSFNEADLSDKPSCPRPWPPFEVAFIKLPHCAQESRPIRDVPDLANLNAQYKSMLASMIAVDDLIGNLFAALQAANVLDDTVVIFTSDNGWMSGEHRDIGKEVAYEESIRVPLVIRAPGAAAGVQAEQVVLNHDLAPTLAALGAVNPPYDPDGASLLPVLLDPQLTTWHRHAFLVERWFIPSLFKFEGPTYFALRWLKDNIDYTYIGTHSDPLNPGTPTHHELYDLNSDPYQMNSISLPSNVTQSLDSYVQQLRRCHGAMCRTLEAP